MRSRSQDLESGLLQKKLKLPSYEHSQAGDPLTERIIEQILNRVSTRRFIFGAWKRIAEGLARPLDKLDLVALYIDGVEFGEHTVVCAIGIDREGKKHALGIWEGSTENKEVCQALLDNLVGRGLATNRPILVVIDGSISLRQVVKKTFGGYATIQWCQYHKRQNVIGHLPKGMQTMVDLEMRRAYQRDNLGEAREILNDRA